MSSWGSSPGGVGKAPGGSVLIVLRQLRTLIINETRWVHVLGSMFCSTTGRNKQTESPWVSAPLRRGDESEQIFHLFLTVSYNIIKSRSWMGHVAGGLRRNNIGTLVFSELLLCHAVSVLCLIKTRNWSFNVVTPLFGKKKERKKNFSAHLTAFKIKGDQLVTTLWWILTLNNLPSLEPQNHYCNFLTGFSLSILHREGVSCTRL